MGLRKRREKTSQASPRVTSEAPGHSSLVVLWCPSPDCDNATATTITVTPRRSPTLLPPSQVSCQALPWHRSQVPSNWSESQDPGLSLVTDWSHWGSHHAWSPRVTRVPGVNSTWASQIIRDIKWARDKCVTWAFSFNSFSLLRYPPT